MSGPLFDPEPEPDLEAQQDAAQADNEDRYPMQLDGQFAPGEQADGYVRGAWDQVRSCFIDGHITEEAYQILHAAIRTTPTDVAPEGRTKEGEQ